MGPRIAAGAAVVLFLFGIATQIWIGDIATIMFFFGVLSGISSVLLLLRNIQKRLMKQERLKKQFEGKVYARFDQLQQVYDLLAKELVTLPVSSQLAATFESRSGSLSSKPVSSLSKAKVEDSVTTIGRAATPEVDNPYTAETLHSMLTPGRKLRVAGIFDSKSLPDHIADLWQPGDVVASLQRHTPEMIVIDECYIQSSPFWSTAYTAVGTARMKEIIDGVSWAKERRVPVYRLSGSLHPDVHSSNLAHIGANTLPLTEEQMIEAAGAAPTTVFSALQKVALERMGAVEND